MERDLIFGLKKVLIQNIKAVYFKKNLNNNMQNSIIYNRRFLLSAGKANQNIFKAHKMNIKVLFEIDTLVDVKRSRGTIWHWQMKHM